MPKPVVSVLNGIAATAAAALFMVGCTNPTSPPTQTNADTATPAATAASSSAAATPPLSLPVSLNAVMVGAIDHASDPLFGVGNAMYGSGKIPRSDADWAEVQFHAYQMVILGKVIQLPGTGPKDAEWAANPQYRAFADSLSAVGMDMLALTEKKDAKGFQAAGNKLIDICESCHQAFKPEIPTMKLYHRALHKQGR